jgi:hypothetical protein
MDLSAQNSEENRTQFSDLKTFVSSPPAIARLVFRVFTESEWEKVEATPGVWGSNGVTVAAWQEDGFYLKRCRSIATIDADLMDSNIDGAGKSASLWWVIQFGSLERWDSAGQKVGTGGTVEAKCRMREREILEVMNLGVASLDSATVKWEGTSFTGDLDDSLFFPPGTPRAQTRTAIMGRFTLTGNAPTMLAVENSGVPRQVQYFQYDRSPNRPGFIPSVIKQEFYDLPGKKVVSRLRLVIFECRLAESTQPASSFLPEELGSSVPKFRMSLMYSNGEYYQQSTQGLQKVQTGNSVSSSSRQAGKGAHTIVRVLMVCLIVGLPLSVLVIKYIQKGKN